MVAHWWVLYLSLPLGCLVLLWPVFPTAMESKPEVPDTDLGLETGKPAQSHVEALRQEQTHTEIDRQLDKRIDRKFDLHIMPWLFGIWYMLWNIHA